MLIREHTSLFIGRLGDLAATISGCYFDNESLAAGRIKFRSRNKELESFLLNERSLTVDEYVDHLKSDLIRQLDGFRPYFKQLKVDPAKRIGQPVNVTPVDVYMMLIGSACYDLCGEKVKARELASSIALHGEVPDLEARGLEDLIIWLLVGGTNTYNGRSDVPFGENIKAISDAWSNLSDTCCFVGHCESCETEVLFGRITDAANDLRSAVYKGSGPRELLFGDIIVSLLKTAFAINFEKE